MPLPHWHEQIGDPTLADSILDRLVHNAYRIELIGESIRKKRGRKTEVDLAPEQQQNGDRRGAQPPSPPRPSG